MIGPITVDPYLVKEGANYIFDMFSNMDEYTSPYEVGFDKADFFLGTRKGLEFKKNGLGYNIWKTEGNIVSSIRYGKKTRGYTDKGYVYNFDGSVVNVFLGLPTTVVQGSGGNDLVLNGTSVGFIQEYTTLTNETVLSSIKTSIKVNTAITGGEVSMFLLDSSGNTITTADNILKTEGLTTSYVDYSFQFSGVTLNASTKYKIKLVVTGVSASNYIMIERSATDVYASNNLYVIAQNNTETLVSYDTKFTVTTTRPFSYNPTIKRDIMPIAYIGGGVFGVTATVSSYDNTTRTVTIGSSILNSTYVAKFAYISAGAVANIRQVRQIESVPSSSTFVVSTGFAPNLSAGDTITFYTKKISQLRFPQLRQGPSSPQSDSLVAIDKEGFVNYFYFPNFKRLIMRDNRIAALGQNEDGIVYSENESLERFTITSTTFGNDTAVNYAVYQSYLLIFFESTIGLIRRVDFTSPIDGSITAIYKFNPTAASVGLYSERSFNYVVSDFLLFGSDKIPYSVGISSTTLDDVKVELEPFGREISNYTKKFVGGEVLLFNFHTNIILTYKVGGKTNNFVYKENTKIRYPQTYNIEGTFMNFLFDIGGTAYSCYNNTFVAMSGNYDLGEPIEGYVSISGPKALSNDESTLVLLKMKVGAKKGQQLGIKAKLTLGGPEELVTMYSTDNVKYIQDFNQSTLDESSIGSHEFGDNMIGTEQVSTIDKNIDYFYLYIQPKKTITTMLLEIKNTEGSQLFIGGINAVYSAISTAVTPQLLVLKDNKDISF